STQDVFLVKYSSTGNVVWARQAGGTDQDGATGMVVDRSGNPYLLGYYASAAFSMDRFSLSNSNSGQPDLFVAKFDSGGNTSWIKSAQGINIEYPIDLSLDPGDNVIIAGAFSSTPVKFGAHTISSQGGYDAFVAKLVTNTFLYPVEATASLRSGCN